MEQIIQYLLCKPSGKTQFLGRLPQWNRGTCNVVNVKILQEMLRHKTLNYDEKALQMLSSNLTILKITDFFAFCLGDTPSCDDNWNKHKLKALGKSRPIGDVNISLIPGNFYSRRLKNMISVKGNDILFKAKKGLACFRGATTGYPSIPGNRFLLVQKYEKSNLADVGFHAILQKACWFGHPSLKKPVVKANRLSQSELLQYKYIICPEGNDASSGLGWVLASNSVPMMCKPRHETWLREGLLKAGIHYILLDDQYNDLERKIQWCEAHPKKCQEIAAAGKKYVQQFMDPSAQNLLAREVMRRHIVENPLLIGRNFPD